METNSSPSDPDDAAVGPEDAAADLAAVADAQRAVRDRPWPLWLYPANAILLGCIALAGLARESTLALTLALAAGLALAAINYAAGLSMGAPFAIPTSIGFRVLVTLSGACVIASVFARMAGLDWLIVACAVGAVLAYGLASAIHLRSTRR